MEVSIAAVLPEDLGSLPNTVAQSETAVPGIQKEFS